MVFYSLISGSNNLYELAGCSPPKCIITQDFNLSSGINPIYITYNIDLTIYYFVFLAIQISLLILYFYIIKYGNKPDNKLHGLWEKIIKRKQEDKVL